MTGTAGFIGTHLARALLQNGTTVIGIDRRPPRPLDESFRCDQWS
ncbi:NAD-dependent epimerase/dehydratase family protein [Streptomyces sp. GQFP]|nr:NAD-dependent epimerase/dehydratase family protein [Streptomyces sp. GQFP]